MNRLHTWGESSICQVTQRNSFESQSTLNFIVNACVENGVPQGHILKSEEPYRVVRHMKALDECLPDQQTF
jgi:hypothetical protein